MTERKKRPNRATKNGYRIALRPDHNGDLDDVVVTDVSMFRMEDMGDAWWICCYLAGTGDERIAWSIDKLSGRAATIVYPDAVVVYESGSMQP